MRNMHLQVGIQHRLPDIKVVGDPDRRKYRRFGACVLILCCYEPGNIERNAAPLYWTFRIAPISPRLRWKVKMKRSVSLAIFSICVKYLYRFPKLQIISCKLNGGHYRNAGSAACGSAADKVGDLP